MSKKTKVIELKTSKEFEIISPLIIKDKPENIKSEKYEHVKNHILSIFNDLLKIEKSQIRVAKGLGVSRTTLYRYLDNPLLMPMTTYVKLLKYHEAAKRKQAVLNEISEKSTR